jgi:hypothetical protein
MSITTFLLLGLPAIPNLFGIWHAFHHDFPGPQERLKWMGACVFLPVLGGIAYLIFGLRRAKRIP